MFVITLRKKKNKKKNKTKNKQTKSRSLFFLEYGHLTFFPLTFKNLVRMLFLIFHVGTNVNLVFVDYKAVVPHLSNNIISIVSLKKKINRRIGVL